MKTKRLLLLAWKAWHRMTKKAPASSASKQSRMPSRHSNLQCPTTRRRNRLISGYLGEVTSNGESRRNKRLAQVLCIRCGGKPSHSISPSLSPLERFSVDSYVRQSLCSCCKAYHFKCVKPEIAT
eukprot:GHVL01025943.1.p1 GENE.GHVL01025943.1~~GHVL01025943.1.p1  ORF type:complete len:125 (-),score=2.09 GHVL01025943.1:362-736(-)